MKAGKIAFAEITDFGATAADRIAGGFIGTLFIDASDNSLKVVNRAGESQTASIGGAPVIFA